MKWSDANLVSVIIGVLLVTAFAQQTTNEDHVSSEEMKTRTPRKIGQSFGNPRNNFTPFQFRHVPKTAGPSPTPATFAHADFVLGRNSKLNDLFRIRTDQNHHYHHQQQQQQQQHHHHHYNQQQIQFVSSSTSTTTTTTTPKTPFNFAEADPQEVWNWLLSQTPSRQHSTTLVPVTETLVNVVTPNYQFVTEGLVEQVTPEPLPQLSVDYQQDFDEDGNNEPRHFLGNDLVIATTAKPLIEADLRDNFRPFLKPHQIENHNEEQNNERFHSTRKYDEETLTPLHQFRFHEPATTVEPYITTHRNSEKLPLFGKDTRKIPRLFRKKFRLPSKVHMERRYINPLFRESLEGAESLEPVLESSPTQQAVYINEIPSSTPDYYNEISSTSNYLNEISESEFDYPRIRPSQRPLTDDRDEALLGNELGPNNNQRPGNHGFHSNEVQLVNENSGDEVNNRPQYPAYGVIPETGFNCSKQLYKGPFADINSGCQVWHYCDLDGRQSSFLCPNGTIFDQRSYTCDWWYKVRCGQSDQLYALNERLFKYRVDDPPQFPFDYHGPHVDQYILQQYFKNLQEMRQKQWGDEGRKARLKEKLREQKRKELIAKLNLELDEATYQKYGFLLRKR